MDREFLQMTMLDTTYSLLSSTPPFSLDNVAPMVADSIFQVTKPISCCLRKATK